MPIILLPALLLLLGIIATIIIFACIKDKNSGVKVMILGISIILFAIIIAVNNDGIEYPLGIMGLIICVAGLLQKD